MSITYAQLANVISEMTDKEKNQEVFLYNADEEQFRPAHHLKCNPFTDEFMEKGHFYIVY